MKVKELDLYKNKELKKRRTLNDKRFKELMKEYKEVNKRLTKLEKALKKNRGSGMKKSYQSLKMWKKLRALFSKYLGRTKA